MADETRHSKALEAEIITDPDELARKESFNTVAQIRAVEEMIEYFLERSGRLSSGLLICCGYTGWHWTAFRFTPAISDLPGLGSVRAGMSLLRRTGFLNWLKSFATM